MRHLLVLALSVLVACSSFDSSATSPGADGGPGSSGGDGDGGMNVVTGTPADNSLTIEPFSSPNYVIHGLTATAKVTVKRGANVKGPIAVTVQGLRAGVTAPDITITGDSGDLVLMAGPDTTQGDAGGTLVATAKDTTVKADLRAFVRGAPGERDTTFAVSGTNGIGMISKIFYGLQDAVLAPDDSLYLIYNSSLDEGDSGQVVHLTPVGEVDTAYGQNGIAAIPWTPIAGALQSNGELVLVGSVTLGDQSVVGAAGRLTATGANDPSFDFHSSPPYLGVGGLIGTNDGAFHVAIRAADGDIFIGWRNRQSTLRTKTAVSHFRADASVVTGFGSAGALWPISPSLPATEDSLAPEVIVRQSGASKGNVAAVWMQRDDGGSFDGYVGFNQLVGDTGTVDPAVGGAPKVARIAAGGITIGASMELADGSIITAINGGVSSQQLFLRKLNVSGDGASNFGTSGLVGPLAIAYYPTSIAAQTDGKIVVGLDDSETARFTATGMVDTGFAAGGFAASGFEHANNNRFKSVVRFQKSGRIVCAGMAQSATKTYAAFTAFWP